MNALLEIARAFARYDAKRAFEIIDPLVEQFNDLCTAARTLEGFGSSITGTMSWKCSRATTSATLSYNISQALATLANNELRTRENHLRPFAFT